MNIQRQSNADLDRVAEIVKHTKFAMLTTLEPDGALHSRPLATMQMDSDASLWFFTSLDSPKVEEISQHRQVNLTYANPDKQDYVSISGQAEIIRNKEKMASLWTPWVKPWFPKGLDDPALVLLKITLIEAEYWDAPGSATKRIYGLAKAIVTGKKDALGENRKIELRH